MGILQGRSREILKAIVRDYIRTAEPVSSKAVAMRCGLGVSPATIRNIMAELEEGGFLGQPHTSAGRVPTDKGFRFYVDSLTELEEPRSEAKELLHRGCESGQTVENVLAGTARALSTITSCAGLMFALKKESFVIRHIKLVPIDAHSIMVVIVSSHSVVHTRLIRMEAGPDFDLDRVSQRLNSMADGLTLGELRARIVEEMRDDRNLYDELLKKALSLGAMAIDGPERPQPSDLYLEGRANILNQPEFRDDFERMRRIFSAFEEKGLLVRILDKSMDGDGTHVYLGSESLVEGFSGLSFVTAPYASGGEIIGSLGVIGPVRMDYSRIIPLVNYTAGLLGRVL